MVVVVSCPVLSSGGGAGSGALSRGDLSAPLGVIPSGSPAIPRTGPNRGKQGKGARKTPIYRYIPRSFPEFPGSAQESQGERRPAKTPSAKNQSFTTDYMTYKAFRGRITPNFDISLLFCLFFQKNGVPLYQQKGNNIKSLYNEQLHLHNGIFPPTGQR